MVEFLTVSNAEVASLLRLEGESRDPSRAWKYLDVRTCEEFALGHVTGAYNVPLKFGGLAGMTDNPAFLSVMTRAFPMSSALIVGCRSGARARTALTSLQAAGFSELRLHAASFSGCRNAFGRLTVGWQAAGFAVAQVPEPGRSYEELMNMVEGSNGGLQHGAPDDAPR